MRHIISFAAACAVTLVLFHWMQSMIYGEVRDYDRPVQTTDIRLVALHRPSGAGTGAGAGTDGQSQPSAPAVATPSASVPVRAESNETPSAPLPRANQEIKSPSPAVAPVDTLAVRDDPPVTVAKKPVLPQAKPQPSEPKTPTPPPIRKNAKQSPISRKPPAALPATPPASPPAKPSIKPPAKSPAKPSVAPQEEFQPRLAATRERRMSAGSKPGGGDTGAAGNSPINGSPSKEAGVGSGPHRGDSGAAGKSPFGSPSKEAGAGSGPSRGDAGAAGNSPVGILSKTRPVYPRDALQRGEEGWVKVSFTITEQGRIENPAIVSSRPRQVFDRAALEAIMQWRFRPKMVNGKPVQTSASQIDTCGRSVSRIKWRSTSVDAL